MKSRPSRRLGIRISIVAIAGAVLVLTWWSFSQDKTERPPQQVMIAQSVQDHIEVAESGPADAHQRAETANVTSVVLGQVFLERPDGGTEGIAAKVSWLVTDGELPDRSALAKAPTQEAARDGGFAIDPLRSGTIVCVAEHEDAVTGHARAKLPADYMTITLQPAGKIWLKLLGNTKDFTVLLTPGKAATGSVRGHESMRVYGKSDSVACGGIPLRWESVRVSILWKDGGRLDLCEQLQLRFREWSTATIDLTACSGVLRGLVVTEDGSAAVNARVYVSEKNALASEGSKYWDGTTGSNGSFVIDKLPAGDLAIKIVKPDYVTVSESVRLGHAEELDIGCRMLSRGVVLVGSVADATGSEQERVRGVSVTLQRVRSIADHTVLSGRRAEIGPTGEYTFSGVSPGRYVVAVITTQQETIQSPWVGQRVEVEASSGTVQVPPIQIGDWATATVQLESSNGQGMKGWRAIARGVDAEWATYGQVNERNSVTIPVGKGRFLLGVVATQNSGVMLTWLGVLDELTRSCRVPECSIVLKRSAERDRSNCTVSLEYQNVEGFLPEIMPLASEVKPLEAWERPCIITRLAPGAYLVHCREGSDLRTVGVHVSREAPSVDVSWPF